MKNSPSKTHNKNPGSTKKLTQIHNENRSIQPKHHKLSTNTNRSNLTAETEKQTVKPKNPNPIVTSKDVAAVKAKFRSLQ